MSSRTISVHMRALGYHASARYVDQLMARIRPKADIDRASEMAAKLRSAMFSRHAFVAPAAVGGKSDVSPAVGWVKPALHGQAQPAVNASRPIVPTTPRAPAMTSPPPATPAYRPSLRDPVRTEWDIVELVPVAGEDEDMDPSVTKPPKSFGELRRGLWSVRKSSHPNSVIFENGQRVEIARWLHRRLFSGEIGSWDALFREFNNKGKPSNRY